ncbi:pre-rRna processing protein [Cardiosporidium cionae]|uniref:Pre-rRna processing protein n=1 Tax=Cardiosporidium cionae TaxID=476202 RepID=A0ABQ7JBZ0_9APIC|nr:pre-rRna processing protein [Cardiosporidium cionae]|eukprot:KAF8821185.1 pre-rRna processing protein [Cardiosporidium cionae]
MHLLRQYFEREDALHRLGAKIASSEEGTTPLPGHPSAVRTPTVSPPPDLRIGTVISTKILAKKEFGWVLELPSPPHTSTSFMGWLGVLLNHQRPMEPSPSLQADTSTWEKGCEVKAVILDVDAVNKIVDLSCRDALVKGIEEGWQHLTHGLHTFTHASPSAKLYIQAGRTPPPSTIAPLDGKLHGETLPMDKQAWTDRIRLHGSKKVSSTANTSQKALWRAMMAACEAVAIGSPSPPLWEARVELCKSLYTVVSLSLPFCLSPAATVPEILPPPVYIQAFPLLVTVPSMTPNLLHPAQPPFSENLLGGGPSAVTFHPTTLSHRLPTWDRLCGLCHWQITPTAANKRKGKKQSVGRIPRRLSAPMLPFLSEEALFQLPSYVLPGMHLRVLFTFVGPTFALAQPLHTSVALSVRFHALDALHSRLALLAARQISTGETEPSSPSPSPPLSPCISEALWLQLSPEERLLPLSMISEGKILDMEVLRVRTRTRGRTPQGEATTKPGSQWIVDVCFPSKAQRLPPPVDITEGRDSPHVAFAVIKKWNAAEDALCVELAYNPRLQHYEKGYIMHPEESLIFGDVYVKEALNGIPKPAFPVGSLWPVLPTLPKLTVQTELEACVPLSTVKKWQTSYTLVKRDPITGYPLPLPAPSPALESLLSRVYPNWSLACEAWVYYQYPVGTLCMGKIVEILKGQTGLLITLNNQPKVTARIHITEVMDEFKDFPLTVMSLCVGKNVKLRLIETISQASRSLPHLYFEGSLRKSNILQNSYTAALSPEFHASIQRPLTFKTFQVGNCYPGYVLSSGAKGIFISLSYRWTIRVKLREVSPSSPIEGKDAATAYPPGKAIRFVLLVEIREGPPQELEGSLKRIVDERCLHLQDGQYRLQRLSFSCLQPGNRFHASILRSIPKVGIFVRLIHTEQSSSAASPASAITLAQLALLETVDILIRPSHIDSSLYDPTTEVFSKVLKAGREVLIRILHSDETKQKIWGALEGLASPSVTAQTAAPSSSFETLHAFEEWKSSSFLDDPTFSASTTGNISLDSLPSTSLSLEKERDTSIDTPMEEEKRDCIEDEVSLSEWGWMDLKRKKRPSDASFPQGEEMKYSHEEEEKMMAASTKLSKRQKIAENVRYHHFDSIFISISKPMLYMTYHLQLQELDKARRIAERALQTISFREEDEKYNIWVAYLNMECTYGTNLTAVFSRAIQYNDSKKMHLQMVSIYERNEALKEAKELLEETCKKFSESKKVWLHHLEFVFRTSHDSEESQKILLQALFRLPKRKHIPLAAACARWEYKYGSMERGQTYFNKLLAEHPKRTDLWFQFLDAHVAAYTSPRGTSTLTVGAIRELFERITSLTFKPRVMKLFFTRWLSFEKDYGDVAGQQSVQEKARLYVNQRER